MNNTVDWSFNVSAASENEDGWTVIQNRRGSRSSKVSGIVRTEAKDHEPSKPLLSTMTTDPPDIPINIQRKSYSAAVTQSGPTPTSSNQSIWESNTFFTDEFTNAYPWNHQGFLDSSLFIFEPSSSGHNITNATFAFDIFARSLEEVLDECRLRTNNDLILKVKELLRKAISTLDNLENSGVQSPFSNNHPNTNLNSKYQSGIDQMPLEKMGLKTSPVFTLPVPSVQPLFSPSIWSDMNQQIEMNNLPVWDSSESLSSRLLARSPNTRLYASISRKPISSNTLEIKQIKAQRLRESFLQDRIIKLKHKAEKVLAVRINQHEQTQLLKVNLEEKQQKAEKQRDSILKAIQERAKEEKQKSEEIALISALQLETKKIEVAQRHFHSEARLQEIEGERQRKLTEFAAQQEAANERRRLQELERQYKLQKDEDRKREMESKREIERQEAHASKEASRLARKKRANELKSLKEAESEKIRETLAKRYKLKLENWAARYAELWQKKKYRVATANFNARIISENSKRVGVCPSGSVSNILPISVEDTSIHYSKTIQKRQMKFRKILEGISLDFVFIPSSCLPTLSASLSSNMQSLKSLSFNVSSNHERINVALNCIMKELSECDDLNLEQFCYLGHLLFLFKELTTEKIQNYRILLNLTKIILLSCRAERIMEYLLMSTDLCILFAKKALEIFSLQEYLDNSWLSLSSTLLCLIEHFTCFMPSDNNSVHDCKAAFLSYILSLHTVDIICKFFVAINGPLDSHKPLFNLLISSFSLFQSVLSTPKSNHQLYAIIQESFQSSDVAAILILLVSLVLQNGFMTRLAAMESAPLNTLVLSQHGLRVFNAICKVDLTFVQELVSSEGIQPQFLHLAKFWFGYFLQWNKSGLYSEHDYEASLLIKEFLILLGNISVYNISNQSLMRFGQGATLLKLVLSLPFEFYCNDDLKMILFPTLLAVCEGSTENVEILTEILDPNILISWTVENEYLATIKKIGLVFPKKFWQTNFNFK